MHDATARLSDEIPEHYRRAELADLRPALVERFLALREDRGLMLWGTPGTGKTHSLCAFARCLWTQGWELRRLTYEQLCLGIRATFGGGGTDCELAVVKPLWEVPKLFLEDVGVSVSAGHEESNFSRRVFETLLDQRIERRLATFITSNKSVEELAGSFEDRVASRLCRACDIIRLTGDDKRQPKP